MSNPRIRRVQSVPLSLRALGTQEFLPRGASRPARQALGRFRAAPNSAEKPIRGDELSSGGRGAQGIWIRSEFDISFIMTYTLARTGKVTGSDAIFGKLSLERSQGKV